MIKQHDGACPYCSSKDMYGARVYHCGACPKVKSIEYYPDGRIKKVEFHSYITKQETTLQFGRPVV